MTELRLEDKLGPTRIGADYGVGNLVEGGVYATMIGAVGIATNTIKDLSDIVINNLGDFAELAFSNPIIPFFGFAAGAAHGLREPSSREAYASGIALAATTAYSLYQTVNVGYGMSLPYFSAQVLAGNLALGATVLMQAVIPVLAVFAAGYAVGKAARWISRRNKRVTKRKKKDKDSDNDKDNSDKDK